MFFKDARLSSLAHNFCIKIRIESVFSLRVLDPKARLQTKLLASISRDISRSLTSFAPEPASRDWDGWVSLIGPWVCPLVGRNFHFLLMGL